MKTTPPDPTLSDPFDWLQILEDLRVRAVDIEAIAHAAAEREPPPANDPETRRDTRRLCALVAATHAGITSLVEEIDAVFARAMRLGDDMTDALDGDKTPIPE